MNTNEPLHLGMVQSCASMATPEQDLPPNAGIGELHSRVLVLDESPQVFEHWLHLPHSLHEPSTKNDNGDTYSPLCVEKCIKQP